MPSTLLIALSFLLLGRPVGSRVAGILGSEGSSLCAAGGDLLEGGLLAEVGEDAAEGVVHDHLLDVVGGEILLALGAVAADAGLELTEVAEIDLEALQEVLLGAVHDGGEHADDDVAAVGAAVFADMLGQLAEVHGARELEISVGLLGLLGLLGVGTKSRAVLDGLD